MIPFFVCLAYPLFHKISIICDMQESIFRIIDANFNRAREAARVMEEFCRFYLNSPALSERVKQLRHSITNNIKTLDPASLICSRHSSTDVGAAKKADNQSLKHDLLDSFTAAAKRLPEALRALAEMTETIDPSLAAEFEKLRFLAYTLEKDIFLSTDTSKKYEKVQLYIVITNDLPGEIMSLTAKCIDGGADCIQLRSKEMADDTLMAVSCEFVSLCKSNNVISIINDRADVAIASQAHGLHLGQNDLPIETAYELQKYPLIIGKSTHSMEQLRAACCQPLTYVGLGPINATPTKPTAEAVGLKYVQEATSYLQKTNIGHAAIGGIDAGNVEDVLKAGAKTIAVCSAVTHAKNPEKACHELKKIISSFLKQKSPH